MAANHSSSAHPNMNVHRMAKQRLPCGVEGVYAQMIWSVTLGVNSV